MPGSVQLGSGIMLPEVAEAIRRGSGYLVSKQDPDGFWRDFALLPGASSTWVTACVAYSLVEQSPPGAQAQALASAAEAVQAVHGPAGWGYNQKVAPDADTTAWVIRWFRKAGAALPIDPVSCLQVYLGTNGGARTFLNQPRYGRWAVEHVDVTPVVGLALVEAGAPTLLLGRLREWILAKRNSDGVWNSFWWTFDAYATARNVEFLVRSGGIPEAVREDVQRFLRIHRSPESAMEGAHLLLAHALVETGAGEATRLVQTLLEWQLDQGGWPSSRVLKIPDQRADDSGEAVFADVQGLMSTAMVVMALRLCCRSRLTLWGSESIA